MSTVQIIRYIKGAYQTNIYLCFDEITKEAFVIDPGYEFKEIYDDIKKYELNLKYIILTHGHSDHTGGINKLKETFKDISIIGNEKEEKLLLNPRYSLSKICYEIDKAVKDNDEMIFSGHTLKFISTPGHTKGSMCILLDMNLFSGDTLFLGTVGRCDLPTGSEEEIKESLNKLLDMLDDDTIVMPGHGNYTSIGNERRFNPFV